MRCSVVQLEIDMMTTMLEMYVNEAVIAGMARFGFTKQHLEDAHRTFLQKNGARSIH
jgi:hypothetical protein